VVTSASVTAPSPDDALVVDRVRALVRDRGTDPMADPRGVRAAVLDDVAAERAQESSVVDVETWAQELHDVVAGYGPLQRLFDDDTIEEIWVKCRLTTV
jgi:pilus assembly protein CpaF